MEMKRGLKCRQVLTEELERCSGQRGKPGRRGEERGAQLQGLLLTLLSNSRKTSFENSGIWFPSRSVFVCSTYTAMGEEIMSVVCASCAARGRHVNMTIRGRVTQG